MASEKPDLGILPNHRLSPPTDGLWIAAVPSGYQIIGYCLTTGVQARKQLSESLHSCTLTASHRPTIS